MLKSRFFIFLLTMLVFTSCTNKSVLIGRTFYHEYGFEMSQKDWFKHGQNGQIVEIHNDGIKKHTLIPWANSMVLQTKRSLTVIP